MQRIFHRFSSRRSRTRTRSPSPTSSHRSSASSLTTEPENTANPPPADSNSTNTGRGQGFAGGEYAQRSRALMDLHRDLHNLGAHNLFDIPRIVVIGNQSAGKSSLVEAVTGINVPRDSGTCTRCPVKCAMTSTNDEWSCTISLRFEYDAYGQPLQTDSTEEFGPIIKNKRDVEIWLRRAQAAILSTNSDKRQWVNKSEDELRNEVNAGIGNNMMMFTKNTIQVDIRGPDMIDLAFVDLPGLIQNADDDSITLVRDLVLDHIEGDNTLILVTVPASDDLQNQAAIQYARNADPTGIRTICVLTKPDTVGSGAIGAQDNWKEVMANAPNSGHYLQHGYYCVKLPDDAQRRRGLSADDVTGNYFDITRPWSEVTDRRRFGIANLVTDISTLLVQLIENNLPLLRIAVEEALRLCYERLGQLPVLPQGGPLATLIPMLTAFLSDLRSAVAGDNHKELAQKCRERYGVLRQSIQDTEPQFKVTSGVHHPQVLSTVTGTLNLADVRQVIQMSTAWELPGFIPYDAITFLVKRFLQGWDQPTKSCFEDIYQLFSELVQQLARVRFGTYRNLHNYVLYHVRSELEKCKAEALLSVDKLLKLEDYPFFTQRTDFAEKRLQFIQRHNHHAYAQEVDVMSWVKTYFDFAMERFTDSMPLMEQHDLVQALAPRLERTLFDDLTRSTTNYTHLLAEDPAIAQERRELLNRQKRLVKIKSRLDDYQF